MIMCVNGAVEVQRNGFESTHLNLKYESHFYLCFCVDERGDTPATASLLHWQLINFFDTIYCSHKTVLNVFMLKQTLEIYSIP